MTKSASLKSGHEAGAFYFFGKELASTRASRVRMNLLTFHAQFRKIRNVIFHDLVSIVSQIFSTICFRVFLKYFRPIFSTKTPS